MCNVYRLKIGFLSTTRRITDRVFDISLSITLVGFLFNFYGWALVTLRLIGLLGLLWSLMSYAMQWIYGNDRFKWWIHVLAVVVMIVAILILLVVFNEDITNLADEV